MKPLYYAAGCTALVIAVGVGLLALPDTKVPEPVKPVPVRYMPNAQLQAELAPLEARFAGPNVLQVPAGFRCYSSESQRYRRVVIVCTT